MKKKGIANEKLKLSDSLELLATQTTDGTYLPYLFLLKMEDTSTQTKVINARKIPELSNINQEPIGVFFFSFSSNNGAKKQQ